MTADDQAETKKQNDPFIKAHLRRGVFFVFLVVAVCGPAPPCPACNFSTGTGSLVPGVTDIGNHTDDGDTFISLAFPVTLYDQTFTAAQAGSNGHLTFGIANPDFTIACSPFGLSDTTFVLAPYWGDQCTGECANATCDSCGIFTAVRRSAPNRIFYIEWRTNTIIRQRRC